TPKWGSANFSCSFGLNSSGKIHRGDAEKSLRLCGESPGAKPTLWGPSIFFQQARFHHRLSPMFPFTSRRNFCRTMIGGLTSLSLSRIAFARQSNGPITATKLSENIILLTGAGGNIVTVTGPDGLLMLNGGLPERSADLPKTLS